MKRLTKAHVIMLHRAPVAESGGSSEIRDEGLLDSALNAPFQTFEDAELYPTILEKAARLKLVLQNHDMLPESSAIDI